MNLLKEIFWNELLSIIELSTLFSLVYLQTLFFLCGLNKFHGNLCVISYNGVDAWTIQFFGVKQIVRPVNWFRLHWTVANAKHVTVQVLIHCVIGGNFWREFCTKIIEFQWIENCENEKRWTVRPYSIHSIGSTDILFISRNTICQTTCWTVTIPCKKFPIHFIVLSQSFQWVIFTIQ